MTAKEKKYFREVMSKAYTLPSRFVVPTGIPEKGRIKGPFKNTTIIESLIFFHWFAGYEFQSKNHSLCSKTPIAKRMDFCHGQPNFPFFHRLYTLIWEREMQKVGRQYFGNGNWTWPFWDWTDAKKCDVCTDDFIGSETGDFDAKAGGNRLSPKSVFHNWEAVCSRKPLCSVSLCFKFIEPVLHGHESIYASDGLRFWLSELEVELSILLSICFIILENQSQLMKLTDIVRAFALNK